MNVDPKAQLGGVPILQLRQFLCENGDHDWHLERLRERFGPAASDVLRALIDAGYAAPADAQKEERYETTVKGRGLASAGERSEACFRSTHRRPPLRGAGTGDALRRL